MTTHASESQVFQGPELRKTALCLLAILAAVALSFHVGGLLADDEQYLYLVKGFFIHRPFENLRDGNGTLFLLRPFGFPLLLSLFYPLFHQHWNLYPWINAGFGFALGAMTFFCLRLSVGAGLSLLLTLAMLANPMIRFWCTFAYSDIPFTFFLMLFVYLHVTGRAKDALPFLAVLLMALRTSGLPMVGAYALIVILEKDKRRGLILLGLLVPYFLVQWLAFGEIPGLQQYFRIHVQDSIDVHPDSFPVRTLHNLRSLFVTLFVSSFFYGAYAWIKASVFKTVLFLIAGLAVPACLAAAAGRSLLLKLCILGYIGILLVMRPDDLVHRMLVPLMPLAFMGAGKLLAAAKSQDMPRLRQVVLFVTIASALDGLWAMPKYRKEFQPRDFSDVEHAGEAPKNAGEAPKGME